MDWFTWTPLELAANFFTATCIFLAGRNSIHTWWTGLVGCVLYGILFFNYQLYADATLQVFFFATGVLGWVAWRNQKNSFFRGKTSFELPISVASKRYMLVASGIAAVTAVAYGTLLYSFTDAYAPWIDSAVLTLSVIGQLLLMRRNIQTWQIWLLVNTLAVPLFWSRELYLTSVMYGFFWVNAIVSYFNWKSLMTKEVE